MTTMDIAIRGHYFNDDEDKFWDEIKKVDFASNVSSEQDEEDKYYTFISYLDDFNIEELTEKIKEYDKTDLVISYMILSLDDASFEIDCDGLKNEKIIEKILEVLK